MNPLLKSLAAIPILDKLYELGAFRKRTFNKEWDTKVHNWLTEDNLNIKVPDYLLNSCFKFWLIDTPLGPIWIDDDLFGAKASSGKEILTPSLETKEKLKKRIEDLGFKFNTEKSRFERI